jgi:uncharacterized protein
MPGLRAGHPRLWLNRNLKAVDGRDKPGHDCGRAGAFARGYAVVVAALFAFVVVPIAATAQTGPTFPILTGRVVDNANLLSTEDEAQLTRDLEALEEKNTTQLVVATVPDLQGYEIEDYGYRLGRHWGIGQAGKDNGAILLVAPNERKVRIEVGYGLEPILTDSLSQLIIQNGILPKFRTGDFAGGIRAGVSDLLAVLSGEGAAVKERLGAEKQAEENLEWIPALIWILILAYILWRATRNRQGVTGAGRAGPIFVPGGWSGGGGSWGGGGGGWGGGGGGFGGGGSSGGW